MYLGSCYSAGKWYLFRKLVGKMKPLHIHKELIFLNRQSFLFNFFWMIIYTHGTEFMRKKIVKVKDNFFPFPFHNHAVVIFPSRYITELLYIKASKNSHTILYQFYSTDEHIRKIYGLDTFPHLRVIFRKLLLDILSSLFIFDPVNLIVWNPQNHMFRISCFFFNLETLKQLFLC